MFVVVFVVLKHVATLLSELGTFERASEQKAQESRGTMDVKWR